MATMNKMVDKRTTMTVMKKWLSTPVMLMGLPSKLPKTSDHPYEKLPVSPVTRAIMPGLSYLSDILVPIRLYPSMHAPIPISRGSF